MSYFTAGITHSSIDQFVAALNARSEYGTFEQSAPGKRYTRIVHVTHGSRSAYAFIDLTNGNILKPASWKAPAKHARGNIFDADHGMSCCGRYSVAYLSGRKLAVHT